MKVAIIGASGYIGHNLIIRLLNTKNHEIVAISRSAAAINISDQRLTKINVDVNDEQGLHDAIKDCDSVYFLVHMMGQKRLDYAEAEKIAAENFCRASNNTNIKKIIYLGGLGNDKDKLSKHLASRHNVGNIFRTTNKIIIEFRASMVIGKGSIGYDIITNLVHKLPILGVPKWATTLTQPIGLDDAISYLAAALDYDFKTNEIIEIGGPEVISYEDLMKSYAKWKGHNKKFIRITIIPVWLSALWLNLFTPRYHAKVGRAMAESLANPMVLTNDKAKQIFPEIHPKPLDQVFV